MATAPTSSPAAAGKIGSSRRGARGERGQSASRAERAREVEGDSFEKTVASGAILTYFEVNDERRRSVGFDFADSEGAHGASIIEKGASGAGKGVADRESGADGRESASEECANGSSISLAQLVPSRPAPMSCSWRVSDSETGPPLTLKRMANIEHTQHLGNCGALLCELVIGRHVPALDALTHA